MIYFTSDTHFNHDKEFLYKPRGFNSVEELNEIQLKNINDVVKPEDTLVILGDLVLGGNVEPSIIKEIKCKDIRIIIGNHDTRNRIEYYIKNNISVLGFADMFKYDKYSFYLSHYPTCCTPICEAPLKAKVINLFGHTHQKQKFLNDNPWALNVGMDAHNNKPISIEEVIELCKAQWEKCKKEL